MDQTRLTSDVTSGAGAAAVAAVRPCARVDTDRLLDGSLVRIEPLRRGDAATVRRLFGALSSESRLRRFFSPVTVLSDRQLAFLTDVGRDGHQAMAAVDPRDGTVLGIARYVQYHDRPGVADVAVAVADEVHRRGVGTVLMARLVACAHASGFHLLTATTLWENRAARALLKGAGFHAIGSSGSEIELELRLEAAPPQVPVGGDPLVG
ncbi:MAG: GNAT family N-acetyltransferase [Solirubrobacteraceae bacterium]